MAPVRAQKNGKRDVAFYQSVKRSPDIPWKICFRGNRSWDWTNVASFPRARQKPTRQMRQMIPPRACYQRQSKKKKDGYIKRDLYKCHVDRACWLRVSQTALGSPALGEPFRPRCAWKRFYALGNRNWLRAEGLQMRFRLHKRNRAFMLLLAWRFLKSGDSAPVFITGCNARAEPHSTTPVIMHWLLNGCNAGEPASESADA